MINVIGFDADDTLWEHESIFQEAQQKYVENLAHHVSHAVIEEKLYEFERKNLRHFGYGIKGFILSMIETAIELTEGKVTATEIQEMIDLGKWMLDHPVHLLPNVEDTLSALSKKYHLIMITKGDLFDQESKIARSQLADLFDHIEIVSEKKSEVYEDILNRHDIKVSEFLMIGNSLKSDILPVLQLGSQAVHIPFRVTWKLEEVEDRQMTGKEYFSLTSIKDVPSVLDKL